MRIDTHMIHGIDKAGLGKPGQVRQTKASLGRSSIKGVEPFHIVPQYINSCI